MTNESLECLDLSNFNSYTTDDNAKSISEALESVYNSSLRFNKIKIVKFDGVKNLTSDSFAELLCNTLVSTYKTLEELSLA